MRVVNLLRGHIYPNAKKLFVSNKNNIIFEANECPDFCSVLVPENLPVGEDYRVSHLERRDIYQLKNGTKYIRNERDECFEVVDDANTEWVRVMGPLPVPPTSERSEDVLVGWVAFEGSPRGQVLLQRVWVYVGGIPLEDMLARHMSKGASPLANFFSNISKKQPFAFYSEDIWQEVAVVYSSHGRCIYG